MARLLILLTLWMTVLVTPSQGTSKIYTAKCKVEKSSGVPTEEIHGTIKFTQEEGKDVKIEVDLSGFDKTDEHNDHGFHIHQEGKLGNQCGDALGHYNPESKEHGGPADTERHVGDLGNIMEDDNGNVEVTLTDRLVKLYGPTTVIGRSIVVHEFRDDIGRGGDAESKRTGNAGPRIGCCVIKDTSSGMISTKHYEGNDSGGVAITSSLVFATLLIMAAMLFRQ